MLYSIYSIIYIYTMDYIEIMYIDERRTLCMRDTMH